MRTLAHTIAILFLMQTLSVYRCAADEKTGEHLHLAGTEGAVFATLQKIVANSQTHSVQSVTIEFTQLTDRVASLVSRFPELQDLEIGGSGGSLETFVDVGAYRHLSKLRTLRSLKLIECVHRPYGDNVETSIAFVENLPTLENLELDLSVTEQDLSRIVRLPVLKSIVFGRKSNGLSEQLWYKLVRKPSLRKLVIDKFQEDVSIHNVFADPSEISIKELSRLDTYQRRTWNRRDVEALAAINSLNSLQIGTINADDITLLTPLKHLTELDVRAKGSVNRLPVVRSSQSLRKLTLVCSSFDAHNDLENHPSLSVIKINGREISRNSSSGSRRENGKRPRE